MGKRPKIFTNSFGQAGGGCPPPSGQPDRFSQFFTPPQRVTPWRPASYVLSLSWCELCYIISCMTPSVSPVPIMTIGLSGLS